MAAGSNTAAWAAVGGNRAAGVEQHHMEATCYHDPYMGDLDEGT